MFSNKALIPIFVVVFVDLLGFSIILPLLPFYALEYQLTPDTIGLIAAVYSVFQFMASPFLGALSDKYGRRPLLIYSQIGSMLGFLLLGWASAVWMLIASRVIDGISGGNITIAAAYVADVSEPKDRASAMGVIGVAFGLGFMLGPFIGGELAALWGKAAPAFGAAIFSCISVLLTIFYLKEPVIHRSTKEGKKGLAMTIEYFRTKNLRTFLLIFFFFALPFALYVSMFSLYAHLELDFNERDVGRFLAYVGFLGIIWQGVVIRPLVKKMGELFSVRLGMVCLAVGLLLIVLAENWLQLALVAFIFSFGSGITRVVISSLITQAAPPDKKGSVLGVSASLESLSRIIGPVIGGWMIAGLHPNYIGFVGAGMAAVGAYLAFTVSFDRHEVTGEMIID
jgi:DHA1 family tetracycline resistance protein-like MFS transporter